MILNGQIEYGKVQFYFLQFTTDGADNLEMAIAHALVSVYSCPDPALLTKSSNTLWACHYMGVDNLQVVPLSSVVAYVSV
jgi:hypothetical protein